MAQPCRDVCESHLSRKTWLTLTIGAVCPGPLASLYYSGQFVPLIVFFLLFLAIVKNNKLHHFVRFNCMQVTTVTILELLYICC